MNNRLWNVKNPNQGPSKKVLCVCSAGLLRSPTLAWILSNEPFNFNTRAAGCDSGHALIPVDEVLIEWADTIVCVEAAVRERLGNLLEEDKHVITLNIPDRFTFRHPELVRIATESLEHAFFPKIKHETN